MIISFLPPGFQRNKKRAIQPERPIWSIRRMALYAEKLGDVGETVEMILGETGTDSDGNR